MNEDTIKQLLAENRESLISIFNNNVSEMHLKLDKLEKKNAELSRKNESLEQKVVKLEEYISYSDKDLAKAQARESPSTLNSCMPI